MNDSAEIQREHFNQVSERYLAGRQGRQHLTYKKVMWKYVLAMLESRLPDVSNICVLEAMCGDGSAGMLLKKRFPQIDLYGFDYSDEMVAAASRAVGSEMDLFQMDILKWQELDRYDVVLLVGGLHHVPDAVSVALANIVNALKPGGLFLNFEPTSDNFLWQWIRDRIYQRNTLFEENTERGFDLTGYNRLLADAGLFVEKQQYCGLLGYVLYYNPDAFPWLSKGPDFIAKGLCHSDFWIGSTLLGRKLSFATWTLARKKR